MTFEFQSKAGVIIEEWFPMGKCPKFIKRGGEKYTRIFSTPQVVMELSKPKTIGALAEKNTREMQKRGTLPKAKPKTDLSLARMTPEQQRRYVWEGKRP